MYAAFEIFSFSMLMPFLLKHFSIYVIIKGFFIAFLTPVILILFLRYIPTVKFMSIGFVLRWLTLFIFVLKPAYFFLYSYFILYGATFFFFWVSYNTRYFSFTNKMNRATSAGHIIIVGPILSSFIPFISGFVVSKIGYPMIVVVGSIFIIKILSKTSNISKLKIKYSFREAFANSKGIRLLKLIQGTWESIFWIFPIYTLSFIKSEFAFGAFLSYLGLLGVVSTLFVTRYSDRQQKRMKFLFPLLICLTLSTMLLSAADSLLEWTIFLGIFNIIYILTYPFFFAIVLDKVEDKSTSMITREALLNSGRTIGILIVAFVFKISGSLQPVFLFLGISPLVYMFILTRKKIYLDECYDPLSPVVKVYDNSRRVVAKVYAWGKVDKMREFALNKVKVKVYVGEKWRPLSLRRLSTIKINKLFTGRISFLSKMMRR